MSPIFRHGRLRLYLLKLLDEAPRHGYEVIRLLQDRFMGVYSPSPGTIYPRLARLEEDGLVTHDEVDGRKVYRITDKGREEIHARLDDLAELEDELSESVRDIAREVTEDVRDTVRSLREEITWAARDFRREGDAARRGRPAGQSGDIDRPDDEPDTDQRDPGQRNPGRRGADDSAAHGSAADESGADESGADESGADESGADESAADGSADGQRRSASGQGDSRRAGAGRGSGFGDDWGGWADRAAGWQAWSDRGQRRGRGPRPRGGWGGWQDLAGGMPGGLERLASDFARELRSAAGHTDDIREGALGDLRDILADTLARIRDEVFSGETDAGAASETAADHSAPHHSASDHGAPDDPPGDTDNRKPPTA